MSSHFPKQTPAREGRSRLPGGLAVVLAMVLMAWAGRAMGWEDEVPTVEPLPPPGLVGVGLPMEGSGTGVTLGANGGETVLEVRVGRGRFLNFDEDLAIPGKPAPFLAVGDPNVADFLQVGPRQVRVVGKRLGVTDLSVTTSTGKTHDFELRVTGDLDALTGQLLRMFPDARLSLTQLRDKIVVEGQARSASEVNRIIQVIDGYLRSVQRVAVGGRVGGVHDATQEAEDDEAAMDEEDGGSQSPLLARDASAGFSVTSSRESSMRSGTAGPMASPGAITANRIATNQVDIINLIRVPTSQQVLLKVRVAELNRTGLREVGADLMAALPELGALFGTQMGGAGFTPGAVGGRSFPYLLNGQTVDVDRGNLSLGGNSALYGTFASGQANAVLAALRSNNLLKILAEPNLVTLNGHQASFLAGGEYPVPVNSGFGGGLGGNIEVEFKEYGVRLAFLPTVEDGETIRLTVDPEVSSIDPTLAATLVPGGSPVPALLTRKSHVTVELKQGETLAIAGLMSLELAGKTARIPGLGDLPYIGPFFSNTTSSRIEKELVVLITPYLIEPMRPGQEPPPPGEEVNQPTDLEFFLMNRIEGRTGQDARSTTRYDDPLRLLRPSLIEREHLIGPSGYSK